MAIDYKNNSNYYKRVFAKKISYKGIEFDSKMEADFAMFLDGHIINYKGVKYYHKPIKWVREAKSFELIPQEIWVDKTEKDTTVKTIQRNKKHTLQRVIYTPDFYLPEYDLWVEIKGKMFFDELFKLRFRLFKHFYPDKKIVIIQHHQDFDKLDEIIENTRIPN